MVRGRLFVGVTAIVSSLTAVMVVSVGGGSTPVSAAGAGFVSLTPGRVLETRPGETTVDGQFQGIGLRSAGEITELPVAGRAGVAGDATAVVLNLAVTGSTGGGYVTVFPCGTPRPLASSLNFDTGQTISNAVTA